MVLRNLISAIVLLLGIHAGACGGGMVEPGTAPHPGDKSAVVCSKQNSDVCGSLWFQSHINTQSEGQFVLRIQAPESVRDLKADLWMQMGEHGHGSAPLQITEVGGNEYEIRNAWFVMTGAWSLRVQMTSQGHLEEIDIPIFVEK